VTFVADLRYQAFEDLENITSIAGSIIWDVSEQFSVFVEAQGTDEDLGEDAEHPALFAGGLAYKPDEDWLISLHGGGGKNSREDVIGAFRVAYTF
jgi:hypothetical protein